MPLPRIPARLEAVLARRVVRFAIVGAAGIPINVGFLWLFHSGLRVHTLLAWLMAFECSALINFYGNQRFTYHEQTHVRGIEWLWRALRAQLSSISGVVVNASIFGLLLALGLRYLEADAGGIVGAFACNFFIANRFVFTPAVPSSEASPSRALADLGWPSRSLLAGSGERVSVAGYDGDLTRSGLGSLAPLEELA